MNNIINIIEEQNKQLKEEYKGSISVSKLCNEFLKEKFDELGTALKCAERGKIDPNYKYAGMSVDDILNQWHEKSEKSKYYGRMVDDFSGMILENKLDDLEQWKIDKNFNEDNLLNNFCNGVLQFYDFITTKTNYKFIGREIPLYTQTPNGDKINGRLDNLFYDENTNAYIIIDYKTTENITLRNNYYHKLLGPAYILDECDMNLYTIQLHIYKKALVDTYHLTTYDKISVYVCNLLREEQNNVYYKLYKQNFNFNIDMLNTFIHFGNEQYKNIKF